MVKKIVFVAVAVVLILGCLGAAPVRAVDLPNLSLITIDGQPWRLSDYKGRVVAILFFATWCKHSRKEIGYLTELRKELGAKGFSVVGLAYNSDPSNVVRFAADRGLEFPVAVYGADQKKAYGSIKGVPSILLVNREGRLGGKSSGLVSKEALGKNILELLEAKPAD